MDILYFNQLPTEINLIIATYCDLRDIVEDHPLRRVINDNWKLLFFLKFPDINVNQIEIIDYLITDFDYYHLIYKRLERARINTQFYFENPLETSSIDINRINNVSILINIIKKYKGTLLNKMINNLYVNLDTKGYNYININKSNLLSFNIREGDSGKWSYSEPIKLSKDDLFNLLIHCEYLNIVKYY